jgi:hypothetical protein
MGPRIQVPGGGTPAPDLTLDLHGVVVHVRSELPDLIDGLRTSWGAMVVDSSRSRGPRDGDVTTIRVREERGEVILEDGEGTHMVAPGGSPLIALFDRVVNALNRGLDRTGILAIHAGAVEIDGRAVILAGPSGRGKSTLVVELVRQGAGLLSDESALVDRDDRTVLPYPRALHLRPATVALIPGLQVPEGLPRHDLGGGSEVAIGPDRIADLLGGRRSMGATLGGVVLLDERLDADAAPRIASVPAAVAVMELLRGTTSASWDLGRARDRLIGVIAAIPCIRVQAGDLAATGAAVANWARTLP